MPFLWPNTGLIFVNVILPHLLRYLKVRDLSMPRNNLQIVLEVVSMLIACEKDLMADSLAGSGGITSEIGVILGKKAYRDK